MLALINVISLRVIGLQLIAKRYHILRRPSLRLPRIKIDSLRTGIHHEVDTRSSTEQSAHGDNSLTTIEMLGSLRLVELGYDYQQVSKCNPLI